MPFCFCITMFQLTKILSLVFMASCPYACAFNALQSYGFDTAGNNQGWIPANATLTAGGNTLTGSATTTDPQISQNVADFSGIASSGVLIRYRGNKNGNVQLFWGITGADGYVGTRVVSALYSGNGGWQTLFLSPRGHLEWEEKKITRLRFDPAGTTDDTFEIDWLRVLSWDYDNDGWRDEIEGSGDSDGDGLLDLEDLDSNNDGISDAWEKAIANAPGSVHFNFDTDGNAEGWATAAGLTAQGVAAGKVTFQVTGTDPQFWRRRLHLQGDLIKAVIVRLDTPAAGSITLFWAHDAVGADGFGPRSQTVSVPAGAGVPRSVYFNLGADPEWKGKLITGMRFDTDFPLNTVFSADWIRTSDGDYDRDGLSDVAEGGGDVDGDGLPGFQDPDSDGDGVSDTEETRLGWNPFSTVEATRDTDGDGTTDSNESKAGTDPLSAGDRPQLGIQKTGSGFDLTVDARPGRSYGLQRSEDLTVWTNDVVVPQVEGSPLLTWPIPSSPGTPHEFFRMGVGGPMETPGLDGAANPTGEVGSTENPYLDNGTLRLGAPLSNGGSFNFLAPSGGGNVVNFHDQGRLIQQSYYAGPSLDRTLNGQSPSWTPWPWNPIQGGDASLNPAQVVEVSVADFGNSFFSRTVPLLWDMTIGEKGLAWMDQWNQFEPGMQNVVRVTCRLTCFRDPADIWNTVQPRHQELPAVYLIRSLSKVVTYQGANPWTNDATAVSSITPGPPWIQHFPTENWVAMVNPATDVGVGLYSPLGNLFWWVGATGSPPGGPTSSQTMHMAPVRTMRLDRDSVMVYRYWIIYGDLATIRSRVYELHGL